MIIQDIKLRCDACMKVVETVTHDGKPLLPEGWVALRWVPGILSPPEARPPPKPKHFCSVACREACREARAFSVEPTVRSRCPKNGQYGLRCDLEEGHEGVCIV
jgi:hypothetical protein